MRGGQLDETRSVGLQPKTIPSQPELRSFLYGEAKAIRLNKGALLESTRSGGFERSIKGFNPSLKSSTS